MSLNEDVKMKCPKCKGLGQVGQTKYEEQIYKIVCPKCYGIKEIDWIENIMGRDEQELVWRVLAIEGSLPPDNYVFVFGGTTYFVKEKHFDLKASVKERWEAVIMNVPFLRNHPGTLDMWRD